MCHIHLNRNSHNKKPYLDLKKHSYPVEAQSMEAAGYRPQPDRNGKKCKSLNKILGKR